MNTNPPSPSFAKSSETWGGLRKAITSTPGFQYWRSTSSGGDSKDLDSLAQSYLRETLETLAY